jgi:hypothetical protein
MAERSPQTELDPVAAGAAVASNLLGLSEFREGSVDTDAVLAGRLHEVGITFPETSQPRGIVSEDREVTSNIGANIVGSPLYAVSPEGNRDEVRMHEMVHAFIQAHLVPDQPTVNAHWGEVTDDEIVALVQTTFREGDLAERLDQASEDILTVIGYEVDPQIVLQTVADSVDDYRKSDVAVRRLDARRGRTISRPNIEAVIARTNQLAVGALRERAYESIGLEVGIDFEEAAATYFALHAMGAPPTAAGEFHQGERAKRLTLALAGRYPDSRSFAQHIEAVGMVGILQANNDLLQDADPVSVPVQEAVGRYEPLSPEDITQARANIVGNYASFEPVTQMLEGQLASDPDGLRASALGTGRGMMAIPFRYGVQECVARIPLDPSKPSDITGRLEGAVRSLGLEGFEQALAASVEKGDFYSLRLSGNRARDVGYDEQANITDEQLLSLADKVMVATAREITIDPDQGNILYDPELGFSILDCSHTEGRRYSMVDTLALIGMSIGGMGRGSWNADTPDSVRREQYILSADLQSRFMKRCRLLLRDEAFAAFQVRMDAQIGEYKKQIQLLQS